MQRCLPGVYVLNPGCGGIWQISIISILCLSIECVLSETPTKKIVSRLLQFVSFVHSIGPVWHRTVYPNVNFLELGQPWYTLDAGEITGKKIEKKQKKRNEIFLWYDQNKINFVC